MNILLNFLIIILGFIILFKCANIFVKGSIEISKHLKIPRFIIAITLVSIATTLPEFIITFFSTVMGHVQLAVGNIMGSIVANICFVLGIPLLLFNVKKINKQLIKPKVSLLFLFLIVTFLFMLNGTVSKLEGLVLLILFVFYIYYLIRTTKEAKFNDKTNDLGKHIFYFVIGAAGVVVVSRFGIIPASISIAEFFGLSETIVGLSLVALGTSLPELATAITAISKKAADIAIGNVIGANIIDLLLVIGVSSLATTLPANLITLVLSMPVAILATLFLIMAVKNNLRPTKIYGALFLILYIAYLVLAFTF